MYGAHMGGRELKATGYRCCLGVVRSARRRVCEVACHSHPSNDIVSSVGNSSASVYGPGLYMSSLLSRCACLDRLVPRGFFKRSVLLRGGLPFTRCVGAGVLLPGHTRGGGAQQLVVFVAHDGATYKMTAASLRDAPLWDAGMRDEM